MHTHAQRQNKPSILYVHSSDELYGADIVLLELVSNLRPTAIEPLVILPTDLSYDGKLTKKLRERGVEVLHRDIAVVRKQYLTPLGLIRLLWRLIQSTIQLAQLMRQRKISAVHSNSMTVLSGALAAKVTGLPHIWHIHEIFDESATFGKVYAFLIAQLSTHVVGVSQAVVDNLQHWNPKIGRKTSVIYNGIDLCRYDNQALAATSVRQAWGVQPHQPLIGVVGRLSSRKGQREFIEACGKIAPDFPDSRFALIGDCVPGQEAYMDELKQFGASQGIGDRLIFAGYRSDIPAVAHALDILVLPSIKSDSLPTVLLEAMAASRPVIATKTGGSSEIVANGTTGLLIDVGIDDIANGLRTLLTSPDSERQTMGRLGRLRLENQFSMESFLYNWAALYDKETKQSASQQHTIRPA